MEEPLIVKNCFRQVGSEPGEVIVEVLPSYRIGTPYEVTIRVKNTGNVPYWGIPVSFAIPKTESGYALHFLNFFPYQNLDRDNPDIPSMPIVTSNLLNQHVEGTLFPMMLPYIGAYQQIDLKIGFTSPAHGVIRIYAWAGEPWSEEFKRLTSPDHSLDEYRKSQTNTFTATRLCLYNAMYLDPTFMDFLNGKQVKGRMPRFGNTIRSAHDLADNNANIAKATGMTIAGLAGIGDKRVNDALLETTGIDLSDPNSEYGTLAGYVNAKNSTIPSPLHVVGTATGLLDVDDGDLFKGEPSRCAESDNPMPEATDVESLQEGDPNDIRGYRAKSGSEYIGLDVDRLNYSIEFENSPEIANAPAYKIVVNDCLDPNLFDLSTFTATKVTFASKEVDIDSGQDYIGTVDMRPSVNAIAQVSMSIDRKTGDICWTIEALDPMTLMPTTHYMQGILPVNISGNGIGTVNFTVGLRSGVKDGIVVDNSAAIVFGANEVINTPVWHNVTDYVRPVSCVSGITELSVDEILLQFDGVDNGSGIWLYDLYCRVDYGEWQRVADSLEQPEYTMTVNTGVKYEFATMATDFAGNREVKELTPEFTYVDGRITSAIDEVPVDTPVRRGDKVYDLAGRRVKGRLTPGIYVSEGRKILVR